MYGPTYAVKAAKKSTSRSDENQKLLALCAPTGGCHSARKKKHTKGNPAAMNGFLRPQRVRALSVRYPITGSLRPSVTRAIAMIQGASSGGTRLAADGLLGK